MSLNQSIDNKKFKKLLSLINLYLEDETNVDIEEIEGRIYEAYEDEEITPTQLRSLNRNDRMRGDIDEKDTRIKVFRV